MLTEDCCLENQLCQQFNDLCNVLRKVLNCTALQIIKAFLIFLFFF